jgi:hypothetical protein
VRDCMWTLLPKRGNAQYGKRGEGLEFKGREGKGNR